MNDEGTWQKEINLLLTTFLDENSCGYLPMSVAMKIGGSRIYLTNIGGDEGRWQWETSLMLTAFQEEDSRRYLPDVSGDDGKWQQRYLQKLLSLKEDGSKVQAWCWQHFKRRTAEDICRMLVAMMESGSRRYLPEVSGDEGSSSRVQACSCRLFMSGRLFFRAINLPEVSGYEGK